jgi:hypothetical protein
VTIVSGSFLTQSKEKTNGRGRPFYILIVAAKVHSIGPLGAGQTIFSKSVPFNFVMFQQGSRQSPGETYLINRIRLL